MTNEAPLTNSQRQAAFRAKKDATAALNAEAVLRLTKENLALTNEVARLTETLKRSKIQHTAQVAKLRGQIIKSLKPDTPPSV